LSWTQTQREYGDQLWDAAVLGGLGAIGWWGSEQLIKLGTTKYGAMGYALAAYAGVQAVGLSAGYLIGGKQGVDDWMRASNTMFRNRTIVDKVPLIGEFMTIIPNPLGVAEVLWEAGKDIGEEYPIDWSIFNLWQDVNQDMPGVAPRRSRYRSVAEMSEI